MKIYFAGSIRGGRGDKETYFKIIKLLEKYGKVLTEHIGDSSLSSYGETGLADSNIYERDMEWLNESEVLVAEVTTPSTGVGYEIGKAEDMCKKILCLYRKNAEKKLSGMISGNKNISIKIYENIDDIGDILKSFFT